MTVDRAVSVPPNRTVHGFKWEPAVYLYALNALVALAAAFLPGLNLDSTRTAAITVIATAVLTAVSVFFTRPVDVAVFAAAVTTGLTAAATFGLHLDANRLSTLAAAISIVLGFLFRQAVSPKVAVPASLAR